MLECKVIESREEWERFMDTARPNTFLHSWQWGEFNAALGEEIVRLGVYRSTELLGVALILKITARRGAFLFCPHGPIISHKVNKSAGQEVLAILLRYLEKFCRVEGFAFIRISPLFFDTPENLKIFQALGFRSAPIHLMHPELAWILDIMPGEDELLAGMRKNTRYAIKKAIKDGVTVTFGQSEALDDFWWLYEATYARQRFVPFSKKYLTEEMRVFAPAGALIGLAHYQGEVVSGAFIVANSYSGFYHHGASNQKFSKLTASHLLQWEIIKRLKDAGCQKYNFWGIAPEDNPKHPWSGLTLFKKGFGGSSEQYVHAQDKVVSSMYYITYMIEKLRRFKRGL